VLILALLLVAVIGVVAYRAMSQPEWDLYDRPKLVGIPSVVSFSTGNCPACLEQKKVFTELRGALAGKARFLSVNVVADRPENRQAIQEFRIQYVPTIVFFDSTGQAVDVHVGYLTADQLRTRLREMGVNL
jgi:thioredoxin-like negative regulator of GroEL